MLGVVAQTDFEWFSSFASGNQPVLVPEVNFWRPGQESFRALKVGEPFFFRLKSPHHAIGGFGFYSETVHLPLKLTWDLFTTRNGAATYESFRDRLHRYRVKNGNSMDVGKPVVSVLLRDAIFLPPQLWKSWNQAEQWQRNIVAYKGYPLTEPPGAQLLDFMALIQAVKPPDLSHEFVIPALDDRVVATAASIVREGQGVFRARLLQHYRRCAITGEHSLPVLDAAHITPYLGPASNHPQNGLVLRADIHRLFDDGYVSVTPDYRFVVSERLKDEFQNGKTYYGLADRQILLPDQASHYPSREALEWHHDVVFRP
ncbi:MAG: hypothetical protein GEEBNDBF_00393 [bacterium]|nr:hypothetical protein [bacterium]